MVREAVANAVPPELKSSGAGATKAGGRCCFFAMAAGASEVIGGLLVALGLLGPLGPAMIIAVMIVAIATVHWPHGLFAQNNGFELPLINIAAAAAIALIGNGAYSLDAGLGLSWRPEVVWTVLALGVIGGFANLAIRKAPATVTA